MGEANQLSRSVLKKKNINIINYNEVEYLSPPFKFHFNHF
jgi:hypothetical protein